MKNYKNLFLSMTPTNQVNLIRREIHHRFFKFTLFVIFCIARNVPTINIISWCLAPRSRERLNKFNLEVAEKKTRIVAFGRFADKESKKQGRKKPDTFDFLGFTHYCSKSKKGWFRVKRKTSQKKYRSSLLKCKTWLRKHLTSPTDYVIEMLQIKLQGYYRCYGITDNSTVLRYFCDKVRRMLFKWFKRRSQRKSMNWDKYVRFLNKHPLPKGRIYVGIYDMRPELLSYLK